VQDTIDELRLKKRRENDRLRHQAYRAAAAAGKAYEAKPRKDAVTPAEREAKQKVYVERSRLRKEGVPEDQLPALPPPKAEQEEAL
jgi:hypothetical protein